MSGDDDTEKQHEPSQKKLYDARKKGEIPRSNDLSAAIAYAGFLLVAATFGGPAMFQLGDVGVGIFEQIARVSPSSGPFAGWQALNSLFVGVATSVLPVLAVPAAFVLLYLFAQRGIVFAPEKLRPKLSRLSPISNAKNKYGRSGLFEFAKSTAKLMIVSGILGSFLYLRAEDIAGAVWLDPGGVSKTLGDLAVQFLSILVVVLGLVGGIDLLWQMAEHTRRNRMSRKELQDESKESEGDPHMKQLRRQRAQEIAMSSMLRDVGDSSVVIVNPEHYAVALKWDKTFSGPPVCMAKGVDSVAARIREAANEAGVPIHRDPPTARALYATIDLGREIQPDQFEPVAAAIRFAERMRQLARKRVLE